MKYRLCIMKGKEEGMALFLVVTFIVLTLTLASILAISLSRSFFNTENQNARMEGFAVAEAAVNRGVFRAEAVLTDTYGNSWFSLVNGELLDNKSPQTLFHGDLDGIPYYFWYQDNDDGDSDMTADSDNLIYVYGLAKPPGKQPVAARALIHAPKPPAALDYALFGNFVHFDNHNGAAFGVTLTTTVWSNSICKVDSAIEIYGQITAVNQVLLNTGPRGNKVPYSVVNPPPIQGDEGAIAPVISASPPPDIKAFPNFDLEFARQTAKDHATWFSSGSAFLTYLNAASRKTTYAQSVGPPPNYRYIHIPNPSDIDQRFPVGDQNANQKIDGGEHLNADIHTLDALHVNDFTYDNVYFVEGSLTLTYPIDDMVRIEGSLIVNGDLTIHAGGEILAYQERDSCDSATTLVDATPADTNAISLLDGNGDGVKDTLCDLDGDGSLYDFRNANPTSLGTKDEHYSDFPAIVATTGLKIDKSSGGPTHIEGTIYTPDESHLHRSQVYEKAFVMGSEIADTVHNCEYMSFLYDKEVKHTKGFAERLSGRQILEILSFDENPQIPQWIKDLAN
jgi:hypothetical protein